MLRTFCFRFGALSMRRAVLLLFALCPTAPVWAQVWQPAQGEGSVVVSYQLAHGGDHYDSEGKVDYFGPMRSSTMSAAVEYGITDRIAISAQLPFVVSKFTRDEGGTHTGHDMHSTIDDGHYRGTIQDLRARIQYNITQESLVLTPFFEAVIPTHEYETFGHSAPGKHLKEYRLGGEVSRWLDPIVPRAYFILQPMYSFVESVADLNLDHVSLALEIGYDLDRFEIQAFGGVQKRLGGVPQPVKSDNPYFEVHDRVGREAFSYAGGGATFRLSRNVDLFAVYSQTLPSKNVHAYATLTAGMQWFFKTRRSRTNLGFIGR